MMTPYEADREFEEWKAEAHEAEFLERYAQQKAEVRILVDGAWLAFEHALAKYLRDVTVAAEAIETLRSLRTAERALVDDDLTALAEARKATGRP